jgi:Family of unknown function (DUF5677)
MSSSMAAVNPLSSAEAKALGEELVVATLERVTSWELEPKTHRTQLVFGSLLVRSARFVRAAYLLADNGLRPEAAVFVRALMEYTITGRWLALNPQRNFTNWAIDDVRGRLLLAEAASRLAGVDVLEPERRAEYEASRETLQRDWIVAFGEPAPRRMPSLEIRARETGNLDLYNFAYRFDSQTAVHPTPFAADQVLQEIGDRVRIRAEPAARREYADPYASAAVAFLDLLDAAATVAADFNLGQRQDAIRTALHRA